MAVDTSFSNIAWAATLRIVLARGLASGIVLVTAGTIATSDAQHGFLSAGEALAAVLVWTVLALPLAVVFHGIAQAFRTIQKFLNLPRDSFINIVFGILRTVCSTPGYAYIVGDPFVYLFNRLFPSVLGVTGFDIVNFQILWIVYYPDEAEDDEGADGASHV